MLDWANQFNIFCLLDNCSLEATGEISWILAAGEKARFTAHSEIELNGFEEFREKASETIYGHITYDAASMFHNVPAHEIKVSGIPHFSFFIPEHTITLTGNIVTIHSSSNTILSQISNASGLWDSIETRIHLTPAVSRTEYISTVKKIQEHIQLGDCYELNYCIRQTAGNAEINVTDCYEKLIKTSPVPFAVLYKFDHFYTVCASPERYIKSNGTSIISQPIKGTAPRDAFNREKDEQIKINLENNLKDKTENIMTVDLVRNDLSRVCEAGSVHASELYGIYSFATVHQMISTVKGKLKKGITPTEIFKATFPMGSMTGAPKKMVMELINKYESTSRGLFSGSIGYVQPNGDLDMNVVIRSIFYNAETMELSSFAGGAITAASDPEAEWEECNLKLSAIKKVLENFAATKP